MTLAYKRRKATIATEKAKVFARMIASNPALAKRPLALEAGFTVYFHQVLEPLWNKERL